MNLTIKKPTRATRTYTQRICAAPADVFPLLCPVREADWIEGWQPLVVVSTSGVAERDCVFVTPAAPANAVWYITQHEPERFFVEMLKISPDVTACKLSIQLTATPNGCDVSVTYSHTSLGSEAGDEFVRGFTEEFYTAFMQEWERNMNHYLQTGSVRRAHSTAV